MIGPDPSKTESVTVPPDMPPGISLSTGEEVVRVPAGLAEGQTFSNDPQAANIVESSLELHVVQPMQPMQPAPTPLPRSWKEAKDPAGVVYYWNWWTRETTYTRPIARLGVTCDDIGAEALTNSTPGVPPGVAPGVPPGVQPMQPVLIPPPLTPPPQLTPLPSGWKEARDPAGVVYYWNSRTRETTYTRPITAVVNDNVVSNTNTVNNVNINQINITTTKDSTSAMSTVHPCGECCCGYCALTPSLACSTICQCFCCNCLEACCQEADEGCILQQSKCWLNCSGCTVCKIGCGLCCYIQVCAVPCHKDIPCRITICYITLCPPCGCCKTVNHANVMSGVHGAPETDEMVR